VSRYPVVGLGGSFDQIGVVTSSVHRAARFHLSSSEGWQMLLGLTLLVLIILASLPITAYRHRHTHEMAAVRVYSMLAAAPLIVIAWSGILFALRPRLGAHILTLAPSILILGGLGAMTTIGVPIWYRREPGHNLVVLAAIFNFLVLIVATFACWFTVAFF
jgi:hypothetical protein